MEFSKEEVLQLLKQLVSTPSPSGKEAELVDRVESWLQSWGWEVKRIPTPESGDSLVAHYIFGDGPRFMLLGHLDTVEPVSGWDTDPYNLMIDGDLAYGLGALDMKGGLAAMLTVAKYIAELRARQGGVWLILTTDEERYSRGADAIVRTRILTEVRGGICAEPTDMKLVLGRRGRVVFRIEVEGRSAHATTPSKGVNAIAEASRVILDLEEYAGEVARRGGSLCVLSVSSYSPYLSVPDRCVLRVDRHLGVEESRAVAIEEFRRRIAKFRKRALIRVMVEDRPTPYMDAYRVDPSNPVVKAVVYAARQVLGRAPRRIIGESVADENYFVVRAGIPIVTLGPMGGNAHAANEYVHVPSLVACARIYYLALEKLLA